MFITWERSLDSKDIINILLVADNKYYLSGHVS